MQTRKLAISSLVVITGFVAALLLAELGLRVIGYSRPPLLIAHPVRGFALRPKTQLLWTSEGKALVTTNAAGFRDVEHSVSKPRDVFRIAVLGDSFAEALQVELDQTFWKLLERKLTGCVRGKRSVEVLNFGVSGYGTAQELLTYRTEARRYRPDLVLLLVMPTNDVRDNSAQLTQSNDAADPARDARDPRRQRPYFTLQGGTLEMDTTFTSVKGARERLYELAIAFASQSRVAQLVWATARRTRTNRALVPTAGNETGLDVEVYVPPRSDTWRGAWATTAALIKQIAREAARDSSRLVVVTATQGIQVDPDSQATKQFMQRNRISDIFYPDKKIGEIAVGADVPAILLAPEMRKYALGTNSYLHGFANTRMGSGHWNKQGHQVAHEIVGDSLCLWLRR